MKKIITICFLLVTAGNSFAQQITFQKTYGGTNEDGGIAAQQTTDGGFIISGSTKSYGAGYRNVYLIKTNANGDTLWTKTFGGTGICDENTVQQTSDGGYIITGYTNSFGAGSNDVYLIKTNANGDSLWTKTFGGIDIDVGWSVQQTANGGYIITGETNSFGSGDYDIFFIKTNANGNTLWTKTFGGINHDAAYCVRQTNDGGYIITGVTHSFGMGSADVYLIKTNAIGNLIWSKTFGGTSYDKGNSVQQTADGGYIIAGNTSSFGAGYDDAYLIKTDVNGDMLWTKTFGGTGIDGASSVWQTTDGGYILTGGTVSLGANYGDISLIKTDTSGNTLWIKTFGGANNESSGYVQQTTDGGFLITGYTESFGAGFADIYLIKTDSNGYSGCNEGNSTTIISSPATQVSSPATIVTSPPTVVTTPPTIVGSGGTVTTLCTTVGINETSYQEEFILFPNPFSDKINITTETNEPVELTLFDVTSRKLLHQQFTNTLTLNTSHLSKGIYIYELRPVPFSSGNKNGVIKKGKVVKD